MTESRRPHILAVEDNPDTRMLLFHLLKANYEIALASSVSEALDLASERPFDLFLLDINLGEQRTGIDLLDLLRRRADRAETPAIAITAYAMPGDEERFRSAGFTGYVSKPFTRKALHHEIEAALTKNSK